MKIKLFFFIAFMASLLLNIFIFTNTDSCIEKNENKEIYVYPQDQSSIDFPLSYDPENPQYKSFSIEGEKIVFVTFRLKGSLIESFQRKYDKKIEMNLVKNIQEIVYFISDYKIKFNKGDYLTFFFRENDGKIIYLRFKNSVKRTVSEIYSLKINNEDEKYFFSDGYSIQPCMTNGPFEGCPQVRFGYENNQLVPVFNVDFSQIIRLPFLAKMISSGHTKNFGGETEFIYSNFAMRAVFKGMADLNNLKKNTLYKKGVSIGKSGFILEDGNTGVVYYLRKSDNKPVSPFVFHHTEKVAIPEKYQQNFQIIKNFYDRQLRFGKEFEKQYYQ